jgi:TfoX/Sxy family transcriptional regulator of competence genes
MAYDEGTAQRLREVFGERKDVTEKKMFGGIAFMVRGNMCCGVIGETLMARVGPELYKQALTRSHAREMDFTGKPIKGFVQVDPAGFESEKDLKSWVDLCEAFMKTLPTK